MTAVVNMDSGRNGVRGTNHDRDLQLNGIHDSSLPVADPVEKIKSSANGALDGPVSAELIHQQQTPARSSPPENPNRRMNDLPEEIQHITQNFLSLGQLFSRLAQKSHNELQDAIRELAKKPLPSGAALNGNTEHSSNDNLPDESLDKKVLLLKFAQDQHARWVKALVITEWSKKAGLVSKLIDLRGHMMEQSSLYNQALDIMMQSARNLGGARLPSPDLKTALQVLSTSEAPWIPDLNYIEPPPISPQEQLKWMDNLNTLLSLRLTMEDHDKIPFHFSNYKVASGRVTFIVKSEFEVDLTIADEDFEKQFWFIDFRFLFSPAPADLSDALRAYLETKVNDLLATEGLAGCYRFLHEFVLTHKVSELRRQAMEMSRGRWVDTIKVERLNRSMAVQYWTSRFPPTAPKSWIIIGVHSGVAPGSTLPNPKSTSRLALRWFRGNQEIKDVDIPFDEENISMEAVLKAAIARHVEHILTSIHSRLSEKSRYAKRDAALRLHISRTEPADSSLTVQLTAVDSVVARIDATSGLFAMGPHSKAIQNGEARLNNIFKDPADEGVAQIDLVRTHCAIEEMIRRGKSLGWTMQRPPVKPEEIRPLLAGREATPPVWYRRQGWSPQFYLLMSLGLSGDQWWLVELSTHATGQRIREHFPLPLSSGQPDYSDVLFSDLSIFVTSIVSNMANRRMLHAKKIQHKERLVPNPFLPPQIKVPTIHIRLSELLPSLRPDPRDGSKAKTPWAKDDVRLMIKGVQQTSSDEAGNGNGLAAMRLDPRVGITAQARLVVNDKDKFKLLSPKVAHDVFFKARTGEFTLRLRADFGQSVMDALTSRLQAIERLVEFLDSIGRNRQGIECETVTLKKVVFTYGDASHADLPGTVGAGAAAAGPGAPGIPPEAQPQQEQPENARQRLRVFLDLANPKAVRLRLDPDNPHIRVLDLLQRAVNESSGFGRLMFLLSPTLALCRTLDSMEDSWQQLHTSRRGSLEIFIKAMDWLTVRYTLNPTPQGAPLRRVNLDLRLKPRRNQGWWFVARSDAEPVNSSDDDFNRALKPIWAGKNPAWTGLSNSAAATPANIGKLLMGIDKAVKSLLESPPSVQQQQQQAQQQRPQQQNSHQPSGPDAAHMGGPAGNAAVANRPQHFQGQLQGQRPGAPGGPAGQGQTRQQGRPGQGPPIGAPVVDLT